MQVREIMAKSPACCTPETSLQDVARMMQECDCGAVPVVKDEDSMEAIAIITDRDIVIRTLARGIDPMQKAAGDAMTNATVTVTEFTSVDDAEDLMGRNQVRRLIVVDGRGRCVGMVAQADIARRAPERETGRVVEQISGFSDAASRPSRFQHQPEEHKPTQGGV